MQDYTRERFANTHEGRMAFVVGSGPSLRHLTPEQCCDISQHVVIAVNGAILAFPDAEYFVGCDGRFTLTKAWQLLKNVDCKCLMDESFAGYNTYDIAIGVDSYEGIHPDRLFVFKKRRDGGSALSADAETFICGTSSAHPAMHLANIMGCSPIVLLGMDCQEEDGKRRFTDFDDQPDDGLFYPAGEKYFAEDNASILGSFKNTWVEIAEANPDIEIINCSGGVLEAFPRKSIDEVLDDA